VARPADRTLAFDVYLLAVGGLALLVVLRATLGRLPRERPSPLDRPAALRPAETQLPELAKLEREVELAVQTDFDAHYRLRPTLRRIAAARLASRGIDLDASTASAAEALGPAWDLVRPDRPRPAYHDLPGPDLAALQAAVDALEHV
jgi:hypothetical protein